MQHYCKLHLLFTCCIWICRAWHAASRHAGGALHWAYSDNLQIKAHTSMKPSSRDAHTCKMLRCPLLTDEDMRRHDESSNTHLVHSNGGVDACSVDLLALHIKSSDRWSHTLHEKASLICRLATSVASPCLLMMSSLRIHSSLAHMDRSMAGTAVHLKMRASMRILTLRRVFMYLCRAEPK